MYGWVVPLDEPLLLDYLRPLLLAMLQEFAQGHNGVAGIDGEATEDNVHVLYIHLPFTV